jgi:hypothetical protein
MDKTTVGPSYKYAWVVKPYEVKDGKFRSAGVEYKIPGENVFSTATSPMHKLIMVFPLRRKYGRGRR